MLTKSWIVAACAVFFAVCQASVVQAASITRNSTTPRTPYAGDFPATYNTHPSQIGYVAKTTANSARNHMFLDSIPVACEKGKRLTALGMTFVLVKISKGGSNGDNDTLNFWVNGIRKYEFNVGAAAQVLIPSTITINLGNLPAVGTSLATIKATYSSYSSNPISMIADVQATGRLSFAIQDDTNISSATVNYTCEADSGVSPGEPIAVNPCCPPWNPTLLGKSLVYVGSGSIADPYTLKFVPSPALITALQSYLNYINSTNSAITKLNIEFQLYDQGNGLPPGNNGTAVGPVSGMTLTANASNVQLHTNYNINTPAIFTGVSTPGTISTPSSYPMQVGTKYMVHTGMWTDSVPFFDKATCAENDVFVRINFQKAARDAGASAVLEMMNARGDILMTLPLNGLTAAPLQPPAPR